MNKWLWFVLLYVVSIIVVASLAYLIKFVIAL